ncbi:MAG: SagB/ThcOx family dehydrogenase [Chloroflexi bacterium]|nr:SagB/ThcOx family dehydrogenase [Chloroflexota bacterium]MBL7062283.1 SagB/ThcOx family dehydrogenase [Dehalococcoidia bacterium]
MLEDELERANAELVKLRSELDKVDAEVAAVKAASLEELLQQRRSIRQYSDVPLTRDEVMKLLWAGQGVTSDRGFRTAPSAGALYPLEMYLVAGNVDNLAPGIYKYNPAKDELTIVKEGDVRASLAAASLGQGSVADGAIDIVMAAVYERTKIKYGSRGERYVHIEVGHAAQNICLQATALGLGLVTVGAFDDAEVAKIVGMSQDESPLYVMPVGRIN